MLPSTKCLQRVTANGKFAVLNDRDGEKVETDRKGESTHFST